MKTASDSANCAAATVILPCERTQAQMFADMLHREVAEMTKRVATAEAQWRRRCAEKGDVEPPERLLLVQGRLEEAVRMLAALKTRFL